MTPASQWRLDAAAAISYDQLGRRGIDRWPVVKVTAIISHTKKQGCDCAVVRGRVTCFESVNLLLIVLKVETGLNYQWFYAVTMVLRCPPVLSVLVASMHRCRMNMKKFDNP